MGVDRQVALRERRFVIGGAPRLIVSGEIHDVRIGRHDWQDRLDNLKATGDNAVASSIP